MPAPGSEPFNLGQAIGIQLVSFQPQLLQIIQFQPIGPEAISWDAFPATAESHMHVFFLIIQYPNRGTVVRQGILRTTDVAWQPWWRPMAVAPQDTIVPTDTSMVVLDARRSSHPAGFEAMYTRWVVDDTLLVQGGPFNAMSLPAGQHRLVLEAVDQYGWTDSDTMLVNVLETTSGIHEQPIANQQFARLEVPVPSFAGRPVHMRFEIPVRAEVQIRIYDVRGRLVASVFEGELTAGSHETSWDPRREGGRRLPSGTYFAVMKYGREQISRKILILQ